jgi:predicted O-methyltransferase YrrM
MIERRSLSVFARPPQLSPRTSLYGVLQFLLRRFNSLRRALHTPHLADSQLKELNEVSELASHPSDINEHLPTIFVEALLLKPKLIVELGVRAGSSTFVLERAARLCGASLVSVDLQDCSTISAYANWHFVQGDDVLFSQHFEEFCRHHGIFPSVDLLFVDTSHYYDHTVQEIAAWFPRLSSRGKVIFHDTNSRLVGKRKDGCFELAWDNQRGVIRAIEEYLGIRIDETQEGIYCARGWLVRQVPNSNGLTIMDRVSE